MVITDCDPQELTGVLFIYYSHVTENVITTNDEFLFSEAKNALVFAFKESSAITFSHRFAVSVSF